ncbi:hypothetical protein BZ17_715 [Yersinia pseudotuberculosis IP 32953]|uniref:Uncharacterized protein n=1 Tax=Yersinia similis TaxID=367190 RepID=A0A0T9PSK1_9GAMM|nr:hypothetical protein BZ17_715 [Yersinia pseudotuberculosis IP 32953]KGA61277.1 hypothetical protein DJ55_255 [Yersinia pseudotuberculosis]CNG03820.1 Uncharacterised protein [Yersinia similis]CND86363.1 Uncharacterised protein [Yersinia pseudotuberculosis]CNH79181.1 Uncharacterised protein [Yersinia similis]
MNNIDEETEPFFIYGDDLTDMVLTVQQAGEGNADAE